MDKLPLPPGSVNISNLADWMELQALLADDNNASLEDLRGALNPQDGDEYGKEIDPSDEEEIETGDELAESSAAVISDPHESEDVLDEKLNEVYAELLNRSKSAGEEAYPFTFEQNTILLKEDQWQTKFAVYIFCLITSWLRLNTTKWLKYRDRQLPSLENLFQLIGVITTEGFLGHDGTALWFGFPREDGSGFLPALKDFCKEFKEGIVVDAFPDGFDEDAKDDGVDVIGWRHSPDGLPGKLLLVAQCGSGNDWKDKSKIDWNDCFLRCWFKGDSPVSQAIVAMIIPFRLYHKSLPGHWRRKTLKYGLIFDRCRVAHYSSKASGRGRDLTNIKKWNAHFLKVIATYS